MRCPFDARRKMIKNFNSKIKGILTLNKRVINPYPANVENMVSS
jgi:hypothetical protein